jgi:hypothetical protein
MIVTKENERLYPRTWEYNAARIMTALAKIIENNAGRVKYPHAAIISDRIHDAAIRDYMEKIERFTALEKENSKPARAAAIVEFKKKLEEKQAINNDPIRVTHTSYITFILNDFYYYFQVDSNPFFPFYYVKAPINGGRYSRDAAMIETKKEWLYDCFLLGNAANGDITEAANFIFNMLVNANNTPVIRDKRRERVPNTYSAGYHYETIYAPERLEKIDF